MVANAKTIGDGAVMDFPGHPVREQWPPIPPTMKQPIATLIPCAIPMSNTHGRGALSLCAKTEGHDAPPEPISHSSLRSIKLGQRIQPAMQPWQYLKPLNPKCLSRP